MSAFLVSKETYQEIANWLYTHDTEGGVEQFLGYSDKPVKWSAVDKKVVAKINKLIELNVEAMKQRYPEYPEDWQGKAFKLVDVNDKSTRSKVFVIKQLQCIRYQCEEGNVPEKLLFKQLETLIYQLCQSVVYDLPEYDRAEWGL